VCTVHGVDWNNNRVSPQDCKMRNHQLRTILHQQQDTITALHAMLLHESRHAFNLLQQ
jgi:hypothetical protein